VETAESSWPTDFWAAVERDGFTSIGVAEAAGGSGGSVLDGCAVLRAVGRQAAPGPWAEAGLLAGLLAGDRAGLLTGLTTVAPGVAMAERRGSGEVVLAGEIRDVPWARAADRVLVVTDGDHGPGVAVVDPGSAQIIPGDNVAGEARDTLRFAQPAACPWHELDPACRARFLPLGALTRAALTSGAVSRILDLTVSYTAQRHQFGRPVGRFQLVQRHLVTLAEQAALVTGAVDAAARAAASGGGEAGMVAAKLIADAAAADAARAAHQAHGAIGVTREYRLHQFTRRLWSWRSEFGGEWATWLGQRVAAAGADQLYPLITDLGPLGLGPA
jgi:acyl-CoA dehydrogenase